MQTEGATPLSKGAWPPCAFCTIREEVRCMRLSELQNKEVINTCDCKRLGYVADLIMDDCGCHVEAIIIPKSGKFCGFFGDGSEYIIPCKCIKRIGPDVILVEIHEEAK